MWAAAHHGLEDPQTQEGGALPLFPQAFTETGERLEAGELTETAHRCHPGGCGLTTISRGSDPILVAQQKEHSLSQV